MKISKGIGLSALALSVALALPGCGDKEEGEEKKATQVAAKVGNSEITVHQLNFELGKLGSNVPPEQAQQVANRVLKSLVDQELLMQKAIDEKVDRDPKVVQALESTRRQILAQAYVERLTQNTAQPTEAEIKDYFDKNPALFSERRIYRLQELSVQVTPENAEAVKAKLGATRNLGEFVEWLKAENIPARGAQSVKNAEQLPLELLPRLHALKDGQALTLSAGSLLNIVYLAGSQSQPLGLDQAKPLIERYLANAKKREVAEAELKRLREASKVEYLGDYSEAGKEEAAAPAAPVATPAPAVAPEATPAPQAGTAAAPSDAQKAIDQGLPTR
jgi:EpsD family peptidyl-prolyl cis-trans isomerase